MHTLKKKTDTITQCTIQLCLFFRCSISMKCHWKRSTFLFFIFFTSFEHEKRDIKQRISATLWISWAESSHRTRRKRGKGWIINHPRAMWRTAWSPLKKWILQSTIDLSKPASHVIYTRKKCWERKDQHHQYCHLFYPLWYYLPQNIVIIGTTITVNGIIFFSHIQYEFSSS